MLRPVTTKFIWFNGKLVPWEKATVHVLSHALHYGSSVFEGMRAYQTQHGPAIFRLHDHTRRLFDSAKIYRMPMPFSVEQTQRACRDVVARQWPCAARTSVRWRGGAMVRGVTPKNEPPTEVAVAAWEWGKYLGEERRGRRRCVRVLVESRRAEYDSQRAKGGRQLRVQPAHRPGGRATRFREGIALDTAGTVSEGSGENIFLCKRRCARSRRPRIVHSARHHARYGDASWRRCGKWRCARSAIPREMLYTADEAFFTGTAVEITPIKSVDRIAVGTGKRGPITAALQSAFFGLFSGQTADQWGWLDPVDMSQARIAVVQ